jgi:hypothetical protein
MMGEIYPAHLHTLLPCIVMIAVMSASLVSMGRQSNMSKYMHYHDPLSHFDYCQCLNRLIPLLAMCKDVHFNIY